jgi:hypothetical protein
MGGRADHAHLTARAQVVEAGTAAAGERDAGWLSVRDTPKRYKHLFVYSGDRSAT